MTVKTEEILAVMRFITLLQENFIADLVPNPSFRPSTLYSLFSNMTFFVKNFSSFLTIKNIQTYIQYFSNLSNKWQDTLTIEQTKEGFILATLEEIYFKLRIHYQIQVLPIIDTLLQFHNNFFFKQEQNFKELKQCFNYILDKENNKITKQFVNKLYNLHKTLQKQKVQIEFNVEINKLRQKLDNIYQHIALNTTTPEMYSDIIQTTNELIYQYKQFVNQIKNIVPLENYKYTDLQNTFDKVLTILKKYRVSKNLIEKFADVASSLKEIIFKIEHFIEETQKDFSEIQTKLQAIENFQSAENQINKQEQVTINM